MQTTLFIDSVISRAFFLYRKKNRRVYNALQETRVTIAFLHVARRMSANLDVLVSRCDRQIVKIFQSARPILPRLRLSYQSFYILFPPLFVFFFQNRN